MHPNRSVPDIQGERTQWKEENQHDNVEHRVFLDERGVNIDLTRRYGRSIGQKRVTDHVPLNTPQRLTVLGAMRWDGLVAFTSYLSGTTGTQFVSYLKEKLLPMLHRGDMVVMDNMRSHHVKGVAEAFHGAGVTPLHLPPYSPDLNPIEMLWSKLKAILRKWTVRRATDLPDTVRRAFMLIHSDDCLHWFAADGYCS